MRERCIKLRAYIPEKKTSPTISFGNQGSKPKKIFLVSGYLCEWNTTQQNHLFEIWYLLKHPFLTAPSNCPILLGVGFYPIICLGVAIFCLGEGFGSVIFLGDYSPKLCEDAWGLEKNLLGDNIFVAIVLGCGFYGLFCLGTSILNHFLLGVLLGVNLLGVVR